MMPKKTYQSFNYGMLSLCQLILSLFVLLVHVGRIFPQEELHFVQKSILGRLAVPFFVISTAFFSRQRQEEGREVKSHLLSQLKTYLLWSLFYLPYALIYFWELRLPLYFLPLGLLIAFFYTGTCYQLWYLPGIWTGGALIHLLKKHFRFIWVVAISLVLYILGSLETYSGYLAGTQILALYKGYAAVFYTSRNGLFYMPIFICLGYLAYDYRQHRFLTHRPLLKLTVSFLFWLLECAIVFANPGLDKNFFIGLLPTSFFFFNWVSRTTLFMGKSWRFLKDMSMNIYFLHPVFIELGFLMTRSLHLDQSFQGLVVALFALPITCLISYLWTLSQKKSRATSLMMLTDEPIKDA